MQIRLTLFTKEARETAAAAQFYVALGIQAPSKIVLSTAAPNKVIYELIKFR